MADGQPVTPAELAARTGTQERYGFSTLVCTPGSLSQPGRAALGTQAGEARLRELMQAGGFGAVRRAAETPLNLVLEARLPWAAGSDTRRKVRPRSRARRARS